MVIGGSVLLVASVFERLGDLRSLETRTAVQKFLDQPPGSDLGMGLEAVLDLLRLVSMVAAGLATAAAILGYHVLKRNRSARIGLSVLAVPLFLTGLATGGFLASVVAASITLLWLPPSRQWFSDTAAPTPATRATPPGSTHAPPPTAPSGPPESRPSPPTGGEGPPPWAQYGAPRPWAPAARTAARPRPVLASCVITWVCCAVTSVFAILVVAVLAADADGLFAELHRQNPQLADQGVSDATLETATWVTAIVCVVWSLVSSGLAVLAFQRVRWAAYGLIVSAGLVALLCLAGSLVSPVLAVPGVLAAAAAVLMLRPGVHAWFARREEQPPPFA